MTIQYSDLRKAAQQALEALDCPGKAKTADEQDAITALKAALAEPVQEPVAWTLTRTLTERKTTTNGYLWFSDPVNSSWTPLYAAPPQRKPLTDEEIDRVTDQQWAANNHKPIYAAHRAYARAIERAHGIGEQT